MQKKKKLTGRSMQENWELGRRKSFALDALSIRKKDDGEGPEKRDIENNMKKQRPRSQSLNVTWTLPNH